jgi:hypothetical protein
MQRRTLLGGSTAILAAALPFPDATAEQPTKLPAIGFFAASDWTVGAATAFRQGLSETGWVDGQNLTIDTAGRRANTIGCWDSLRSSSAARRT